MRVRRLPGDGRYEVLAVCDDGGTPELLKLLDGLGANLGNDGDRLIALLERVVKEGPPRNTNISHKLNGEIWEFIQGRLRVCWFYDAGGIVVCTHGFIKKSQKTPEREIKRAERYRQAYFKAKAEGRLYIEEEDDGCE